MALVRCRECGREISDQAPACPGCGAPLHVAGGVPAAWVTPPPPPQPSPPAAAAAMPPLPPPVAKKKSGCAVIVALGLGALVLLVLLGQCVSEEAARPSPGAPGSTSASKPAPAATAEDRQRGAASLAERPDDPTVPVAGRISTAQTLVRDHAGTAEARKATDLLPALQAEQAEAERGKQWNYNSYEDDMSGKQVATASVSSSNSFEFDFPYQGEQKARLTLRRHPRWGNDVIFAIEKGQLLCHTYNCAIRVPFDDAPAQTFTGTEPEDNSSEVVFIPAYGTFARKLPQARRVRIEAAVYQQGTLVADFDVDGFKPDRLTATK